MGGDKGPHITIKSALMAIKSVPDLHLILCGDTAEITSQLSHYKISPEHLAQHNQLSILHTTQIVGMDEKPTTALRTKKDSSMRVALDLVASEKAQACVSAGNTGALFTMAHLILKTLPGIERPALISSLPTRNENRQVFMLDLGANVFCDSHVLYQFGVMGSVVAEQIAEIEKPRIALLNMGGEAMKGSDHIKQAAIELTENSAINYIGFIEGHEIFSNKADVIVCDGFVGNVALKTCEGVARMVYKKSKEVFNENIFIQILSRLLKSSIKKVFKTLNPDQYNGASLIGLRGIVVKSHGDANEKAFYAAILQAVKEIQHQVPEKINTTLEQG